MRALSSSSGRSEPGSEALVKGGIVRLISCNGNGLVCQARCPVRHMRIRAQRFRNGTPGVTKLFAPLLLHRLLLCLQQGIDFFQIDHHGTQRRIFFGQFLTRGLVRHAGLDWFRWGGCSHRSEMPWSILNWRMRAASNCGGGYPAHGRSGGYPPSPMSLSASRLSLRKTTTSSSKSDPLGERTCCPAMSPDRLRRDW